MPNVSFSDIVSATGSPGNFNAGVVSQNFNNVRSIANTAYYGFDSFNYATDSAGFASQHISTGQIETAHLTSGAIALGKINSYQIESRHVNFKSSDGGIMAVQHAATSSVYRPTPCRCSLTFAATTDTVSCTSVVFTYSTHAIEGNPAFTAGVIPMGGPVVRNSVTGAENGVVQYAIYAMNSISCGIKLNFSAAINTKTNTCYMGFMGWA